MQKLVRPVSMTSLCSSCCEASVERKRAQDSMPPFEDHGSSAMFIGWIDVPLPDRTAVN